MTLHTSHLHDTQQPRPDSSITPRLRLPQPTLHTTTPLPSSVATLELSETTPTHSLFISQHTCMITLSQSLPQEGPHDQSGLQLLDSPRLPTTTGLGRGRVGTSAEPSGGLPPPGGRNCDATYQRHWHAIYIQRYTQHMITSAIIAEALSMQEGCPLCRRGTDCHYTHLTRGNGLKLRPTPLQGRTEALQEVLTSRAHWRATGPSGQHENALMRVIMI